MSGSLFVNSLMVGGGATVLALVSGILVALALAGAGGIVRKVLIVGTLVNLALPPFLAANHWLDLTANWRAMAATGALSEGALTLTALTLAGLLWPLVTLMVLGAWSRLQPAHLETDPCVRGGRLLSGFLLPAARGELILSASIVLTLALANFTVPVLFQVRVFTEEFWIRFNTQLDLQGALRATWPLLVTPLLLLLFLSQRPVKWPRWQEAVPAPLLRRRLTGLWTGAVALSVLWMGLTVVFPVARLVGTSRTWSELPGALAAGQGALWNSFLTASLTATTVVVPGLVAGVFGFRFRDRGLFWLPFLIPGVVSGVLLIVIFNRPSLSWAYQSLVILWVALALRYFALGRAVVREALDACDPSLADVARSLGAGRWRVFCDAILPQVFRGCAVAWYIVYLLCLWDVESVVLIQPPGGETLALRIFNLLHYGHAAQVNALGVALLALALAPWVMWSLGRWWADTGFRGIRSGPRWALVVVVGVLCIAGCTKEPAPGEARIGSTLFPTVTIIGSRGVAPGQFNKPRSLVCDRDDNLYVADITGRIQKFSPGGQYLLQWQMPQTDLGKPKGMALDHDGNVVVLEPHYMRVNHFTTEGRLVAQWGGREPTWGNSSCPAASPRIRTGISMSASTRSWTGCSASRSGRRVR